jgi:hypothetical protein
VEDGAKVRGTLAMGGRERQVKGSIGTYRAHRQLRLNFASMLYRITIEYALQWRHQEKTDERGVPEGPGDVTVTLRFSYESGMPVIGSLLDRFARVDVSAETLKSSLEGLKAHSALPSDATGR